MISSAAATRSSSIFLRIWGPISQRRRGAKRAHAGRMESARDQGIFDLQVGDGMHGPALRIGDIFDVGLLMRDIAYN